ncbi:MAG: hypothetical protein FP826_06775 [Sphingomonadales bacterium]|nr:hypothetical protein [Sphingomonadales bacterium]MBU3992545.1 hypothetical protein [Alphaproteobacteria bacterium]
MNDKRNGSDKRAAIRRKIEASQVDLAKVRPPVDAAPEAGFTNVALGHPLALVLGGLALGAVAGALLPKSLGRRIGKGAVAAATIAAELGLAYGRQALEKTSEAAREGRQKLGTLGETVGDEIVIYGKKAANSVDLEPARENGMKLARKVRKLTSQLRH